MPMTVDATLLATLAANHLPATCAPCGLELAVSQPLKLLRSPVDSNPEHDHVLIIHKACASNTTPDHWALPLAVGVSTRVMADWLTSRMH